MSIKCDDYNSDNKVSMICFNAGNGDWYITMYEEMERPRTIRFSTSGGKAPIEVLSAVAALGRAMELHELNDFEICETNRGGKIQ